MADEQTNHGEAGQYIQRSAVYACAVVGPAAAALAVAAVTARHIRNAPTRDDFTSVSAPYV